MTSLRSSVWSRVTLLCWLMDTVELRITVDHHSALLLDHASSLNKKLLKKNITLTFSFSIQKKKISVLALHSKNSVYMHLEKKFLGYSLFLEDSILGSGPLGSFARAGQRGVGVEPRILIGDI